MTALERRFCSSWASKTGKIEPKAKKTSIFHHYYSIFYYLCARKPRECTFGEMAEWSIASVLKTDVLKGTGGSNPSLSAESKIDDF